MADLVKQTGAALPLLADPSDLLENGSDLSEGWSTEDLRQIVSSAQALKSKKSAARIKATAKLALIARQAGKKSQDLSQILFELNPSTRLLREHKDYIVVQLAANFRLPKLPPGYGFKGGAARIAMAHVAGWDTRNLKARDFDIVRLGKGNSREDKIIASRFMPEDFSHGHGIEVLDSIEKYMATRDLSVNEVILAGRKLIFSRAALEAFRARRLELSSGFLGRNPEVPGRIICKILRFAAEFEQAGQPFRISKLPQSVKVTKRDVALHSIRAAQSGPAVKQRYLELCKELIGVSIDSSDEKCLNQVSKPSRQASPALRLQNEFRRSRKHS